MRGSYREGCSVSVHQVDNVSDGQGSLPRVPGAIRQLLLGLGEDTCIFCQRQHMGLSSLLWAAEAGARVCPPEGQAQLGSLSLNAACSPGLGWGKGREGDRLILFV